MAAAVTMDEPFYSPRKITTNGGKNKIDKDAVIPIYCFANKHEIQATKDGRPILTYLSSKKKKTIKFGSNSSVWSGARIFI